MALEEEEEESEEELDDDVEFLEFDGCWWGCEWVPGRQQYCWWLAAADGSRLAIRSGGARGSSGVDQGDLEPFGTSSWLLWTVYEMACFFMSPGGKSL